MPDLIEPRKQGREPIARDRAYARREAARFDPALRRVLLDNVNRNTLADQGQQVVSGLRRIELRPRTERQSGGALLVDYVVDRVPLQQDAKLGLRLNGKPIDPAEHWVLAKGDRVVMETAGGGGYGKPE